MIALTVGGTLVAAVLYAVLTRGRNWRRELFSARVMPFVFVGLAVVLTTLGIGLAARESADEALRLAVADIEADCDDQLSLLLHADAEIFVDEIVVSNRLSVAELRRLSDYLCIDEVTVYDRSGRVVCTTDPGLKVGETPFLWDNEEMRPYRDLLTGRRKVLRQRFRPNVTAPDRLMKYFAMTMEQGGVIQVGYLWETFEREFRNYLEAQFEYRVVGESGFCIVLDGQNRVDLDAAGHPGVKGMSAADVGLTPENLRVPLGTVFRANLFGTPCRCLFYRDTIADLKIMAAVPLSEGQEPVLTLACGIAFVVFSVFLFFRLVLRKFRLQQAKIDALRATEEAHRAADLALARAIQRAELRTDGTEGPGYRITSLMDAAREVGGDFYDYYELPDGRLVVTVADVSGKGVPAAFFMMKARTTLKSCIYMASSLSDAVATANGRLAGNNPAEMFVTAWIGVYDRKTGALDYVSAGHNPPLRVRGGEKVEGVERVVWVEAPRCAALGVFEGARYRSAQTVLVPGDRLFLYTDGVTEAMNAAGELFGNDRLAATLGAASGPLVPVVRAAVDAFVSEAEQSDDITMLELEIS